MTINGNMKFFELSRALYKNGDTVSASSGASSEDNLIDFNKYTYWESVGSDDTTTETITITFASSTLISRLFLINHNFKSYTITPITSGYILDEDYDPISGESGGDIEDSGGTIPFVKVTSLTSNTEIEGISETDYGYSTSYYEFESVYCSGITISVTEAQIYNDVADKEKYCYMIVPTVEVDDNYGTFDSYPDLQRITDISAQNNQTINRLSSVRKLNPVFSAAISVNYTNSQADIDLIEHLQYRPDDFIFWPNGGMLTSDESTDYSYRFNNKPYRLQDIYQCQIDTGTLSNYINNISVNPVVATLGIKETI